MAIIFSLKGFLDTHMVERRKKLCWRSPYISHLLIRGQLSSNSAKSRDVHFQHSSWANRAFLSILFFSIARSIFSVSSCVFLQELSLAGPACEIKKTIASWIWKLMNKMDLKTQLTNLYKITTLLINKAAKATLSKSLSSLGQSRPTAGKA